MRTSNDSTYCPDPPDRGGEQLHVGWWIRAGWTGPALVAAVFLTVLGGIVWMLSDRSHDVEEQALRRGVRTVEAQIAHRMEAVAEHMGALAALDEPEFERSAEYLADHPELVQIRWYDPDESTASAVYPPPGPSDADAIASAARPLSELPPNAKAMYVGPMASSRGETIFELHTPRAGGGRIVTAYSGARFLRSMLPREVLQAHHVSLLSGDGTELLCLPSVERVDPTLVATCTVPAGDLNLRVQLARYGSGFWGKGLALLAGLCVALVAGTAWGVWKLNRQVLQLARMESSLRAARDELSDRVAERTADLAQANKQLQEEMQQRQQAETRARQRQEELAHVARVGTMGEMASGLAHELNQPLGAIRSYAEGVLRRAEAGDFEAPAEVRDALDQLADQASRAGQIIHRLRAFVASGEPHRAPHRLDELVGEVLELLSADLKQAEVTVDVHVPADLPAIRVDGIQTQQVLVNLLRNAVEAIRAIDSGNRRIEVRAEADGEDIRLTVTDTGPTVPPEVIDRLFEAFYTTKTGGLGMGLPISRSIIEAHGGRMSATANHNGGLTIWLTLPVGATEGVNT